MTKNNKIKEQKIKELAEAFKEKNNSKNDNTLNGVILPDDEGTNITELENDIKKLEEAIFTEDNLKYIKADEGSDLYDFLNNDKCTIDDIIDNNKKLANDTLYKVLQFAYKTNFNNEGKVFSTNGFGINHINNNHFVTIDRNEETIFDSVKDGRQPINPSTFLVDNQCCGIYALEGVLIAEALKSLNDNDEKYNDFVSKYKNAFLDDEKEMTPEEKANREKNREELKKILEPTKDIVLVEQRKILFKMEVLSILMSMVQTDEKNEKVKITPPNITDDPDFAICETGESENEIQIINNITCINKLQKLYFEEFQARCAALQAVKQELGLKLDKVKLDKVPEAQKVETPKQSDPAVIQQIKQEKEIKTEKPKVEIQQDKIKKEDTPKVKTEAQKPATRIVVEEPKKEEKPQIVEKQDKAVDTQKTTEEQERDTPTEPNPSMDSQSSAASSTSTSKTPRYKVLEKRGTKEEKDAGFETYDVNNQPIDIEDESVKLYNKFLDQVLEEFKKEGKIVNIVLIKKEVEKKLFACFSIRNEKGETINETNYSKKDEKDIELAKQDYKYTAENSELIKNRFNAILKEYNKRLTSANKEVHERILKEQEKATASVKMQ